MINRQVQIKLLIVVTEFAATSLLSIISVDFGGYKISCSI